MIDAGTGLRHLPDNVFLDRGKVVTRVALVNQLSRRLELLFVHGTLHLNDAVLHFALIDDQDHQHPVTRQRQKFDLSELTRRGLGHRHDAGLIRDLGQQI